MAPKQHPGKEVMTSTTVPLSPPPVIECPITDREFFPFQRYLSLFEAIFRLFHGESPMIHHDLVILGSLSPLLLILPNFRGFNSPEICELKLETERFLLHSLMRR